MMNLKKILTAALMVLLLVSLSWPATPGVQAEAKPGSEAELQKLEDFWQQSHSGLKGPPVASSGDPLAASRHDRLAKASPDECYQGIGQPYVADPSCPGVQGIPKVNQAYVWGLSRAGENLWFGTAPNVHCLVIGGFLQITVPHETDAWVCEFGASQFSPQLPDLIGDWRPSDIFVYNTESHTLVEKTPLADPRLYSTTGLRSAGTLGQVVFLGGPDFLGGIDLFAYNTQTGNYIGSANLPEYNNIRHWLVLDGVLYAAVGKPAGGGSLLRWRGDETKPFEFEVVGNFDTDGADLVYHEGRIFVSTWPNLVNGQAVGSASLWMSPPVPQGGLTAAEADQWEKVWSITDYEPDPVTAAVVWGGALASYGGYLYWGTMHVPFFAAFAHFKVYGTPEESSAKLATILGSHRAIAIFRGQNFATQQKKIELLYGDPNLPVYSPVQGWQIVPNKMGAVPLYGPSGFGNFYNTYTWTMAVLRDQLFVGTFDWSYLMAEGIDALLEYLLGQIIPARTLQLPTHVYGADLFRFDSPFSPAFPESLSGVGNYTNYGIRTMELGVGRLYLGMANPMNLLTDPDDELPEGGWELIELQSSRCRIGLPIVIQTR